MRTTCIAVVLANLACVVLGAPGLDRDQHALAAGPSAPGLSALSTGNGPKQFTLTNAVDSAFKFTFGQPGSCVGAVPQCNARPLATGASQTFTLDKTMDYGLQVGGGVTAPDGTICFVFLASNANTCTILPGASRAGDCAKISAPKCTVVRSGTFTVSASVDNTCLPLWKQCSPGAECCSGACQAAGEDTSADAYHMCAPASFKPGEKSPPPSATTPSSSPSSSSVPDHGGSGGCFDRWTSSACRLAGDLAGDAAGDAADDAALDAALEACFGHAEASRTSAAERVLMSDLVAGDRVLTATAGGELAPTTVVANQHASSHQAAAMVTLHTKGGSRLSLTPEHALYVNGALVAAGAAKAGDHLTGAQGEAVKIDRVTAHHGAVINPVTAAGTLLAAGAGSGDVPLLAGSHPIAVAAVVVEAPVTRAVVNAALLLAGDVDTVAEGVATVLGKLSAAILVIGTAARVATRAQQASQ